MSTTVNSPRTNTLSVQTGKLGRPFRLIYTKRDGSRPEKWTKVNGSNVLKCCWISLFKYTDEEGGYFSLHEDWHGGKSIIKNPVYAI